ncbi:MAG: DUF4160 domain-containing protein [Flavobacterium sp.]
MKIAGNGKYSIYVYKDHPPPHCHVRCKNGEEWIIEIPLLTDLFGQIMPKDMFKFLTENITAISVKWEELN